MKPKTSFFDLTAFKKDVTRFAPSWVLYLVFLLLMISLFFDAYPTPAAAMEILVSIMAVVQMLYALLNAQLLFGDLYNVRLCNALHAMPLRRECWFVTHVAAGLAFSLVPGALIALIAVAVLGEFWAIGLWWLLAMALEYLFFFGLAVCSALCVGNRFAQALLYTLLNFLSELVYGFLSIVYVPLLYGIELTGDRYMRFCPVVWLSDSLISVDATITYSDYGAVYTVTGYTLGARWWDLAVCAVLGAVLLVAAVLLYRKRKLECAGDFMAVQALNPMFLVVYSLAMGTCFCAVGEMFGTGTDVLRYALLLCGLTVGFFTGQMLLHRTVRVFRKKTLAGFALLSIVLIGSLVMTKVDALGITRRIPDSEDVASVSVQAEYMNIGRSGMTGAEEIQDMLDVHSAAVNGQALIPAYGEDIAQEDMNALQISLSYSLKDGSHLVRHYEIAAESHAGQILRGYFSSVECVLDTSEEAIPALAEQLYYAEYYDNYLDAAGISLSGGAAQELLQAIAADCAAGNMAQVWGFHGGSAYYVGALDLQFSDYAVYLSLYSDCENTLRWLTENGIDVTAQESAD